MPFVAILEAPPSPRIFCSDALLFCDVSDRFFANINKPFDSVNSAHRKHDIFGFQHCYKCRETATSDEHVQKSRMRDEEWMNDLADQQGYGLRRILYIYILESCARACVLIFSRAQKRYLFY